ncbi:MAG: hypothetical protein NMNS01_23070 [Nitrosomonas sp.]|jgi:predicted Zn finger-like uncharacterized protein|nr:MAG: hypothetical protein NMNS01_23070 [Nitrosomonas sp.]
MALVTLCPGCRTTFRVTPAQLKAHGGDVRCGQCGQVFNSFATLITVDESEIGNSSKAANKDLSEEKINASVDASSNPILPDESAKPLSYYLRQEPEPEPATIPDPAYNFDVMLHGKNPRIWIIAGMIFLLLTMALAGYVYRAEISAAPGARPVLERLCAIFSCTVPYPQDIALLSIESSDLQVDLENHPDVVRLTAIIRNFAPFPQALPALKLTLTDSHDQTVASHLFTASEYLGEEKDLIRAIEPDMEINAQIDIKNPRLHATGYRLLLTYP